LDCAGGPVFGWRTSPYGITYVYPRIVSCVKRRLGLQRRITRPSD